MRHLDKIVLHLDNMYGEWLEMVEDEKELDNMLLPLLLRMVDDEMEKNIKLQERLKHVSSIAADSAMARVKKNQDWGI